MFQICNAHEDTWKHAPVECNMEKSVWSLVDELVEHLIACRLGDARLWLVELQESMGQEAFLKTLMTLWMIWWARCKAIHEENSESPLSTFSVIWHFMNDLGQLPIKLMV